MENLQRLADANYIPTKVRIVHYSNWLFTKLKKVQDNLIYVGYCLNLLH